MPLLDCPIEILRDYLRSKSFYKIEEHSNSVRETWSSEDNFSTVRFPVDEDPVPFDNIVAVMELQLKKGVWDIPFYARQMAQFYDEEGRGPSC